MFPVGREGDGVISIAFDDIPEPDFADAAIVSIPGTSEIGDAASWARQIFSVDSAPTWVRLLLALLQALVGLIGIDKGDSSVFDVDRVVNDEALIAADDTHLDFRAAVSLDRSRRLVQVTTVVRLHGWRGRLYWMPVSILHGPVVRSMMKRAVKDSVLRSAN